MDREDFKQKAYVYLTGKYPELGIKLREGFELETKNGMVIFLEGSYVEAMNDDFFRSREILDKLIRVHNTIEEVDLKWEDVKDKVYPQIKITDQLKMNIPSSVKNMDEMVTVDFFEELVYGFVIDKGESFVYISKKQLEMFETGIETLKTVAIDNLVKLEREKQKITKVIDSEGAPFVYCDTNDGYAAARILLPDFYERMMKELGDTFIVAIPERDFLLAGIVSKENFMQKIMTEKYSQSGHPVCPVLLQRKPEGWVKVVKNVDGNTVK